MLIAVAPLVLEGDYASYAVVRTTAGLATAFDTPVHGSCFNDLETMLIYVDVGSTIALIRVSDASIISETANFGRGFASNQHGSRSVLGTYMAIVGDGENNLHIYKDGVLIQTFTRTDANDEWYGAIVSPSGRYIAVPYWDNSAGIYKVDIYEGSP